MPLAPRISSLAPASRAEFSQQEFADLINRYGYDVRWSKFMICPNMNPVQPEHHMPDCPYCDHSGRMFYDTQLTRMFASSFAIKPQYQEQGRYDHGTVYFTTLPGVHISYRDKIEMITSQIRYSERLVMTSATTYRTRFPVIAVKAAITNTNVPVPLSTITTNANGSITFNSLPTGAFVSIAYDHHPVYTVVDVMHIIRDSRTTQNTVDTPTEFNRQVVAQLEFTLRDQKDPNAADNS